MATKRKKTGLPKKETLNKLVAAVKAEQALVSGEGRRVSLDLDDRSDLKYDLKAREVASFLRSTANREELRRRLCAEDVKYHPTSYQRASSSGGHRRGFVVYRSPAMRAHRFPASILIKFGAGGGCPTGR